MIVTKEMANRYLIKRGCCLIKNGADGYVVQATSINWKEGWNFMDPSRCQYMIKCPDI